MLEDQVAYLLQRYLGNYVRGLNKEALKISVWEGNVELTNMQLKPEALNALKLPVRVKAGFLGSVKLKVPWSRLGQEPVVVFLDRIFLLAEPATTVEGCSEDAIQEAKRKRIHEMETKLLERSRRLKTEMNKSWMGSLINTIIGNLKLSISNIHIRYEDLESNPGHSFSAGATLEKLSAVTVDESGKETFITGGALDSIQKSVELDQLAFYLDSDISPWHIDKRWEDLLPFEWAQIFKFGTKDGKPADRPTRKHFYMLQPVTGNAKYAKLKTNEYFNTGQPLQKASVHLDDVTLCLSKDGYRDVMKLADNVAAFNQRLKYAHYRPSVPMKFDPRSWWKYAYRVISEQIKKASGRLSWEQVLKYASLRKRYITLYASLLKSDISRTVVVDNEEIEALDRELDIEVILQWRMLAHKFVERSVEAENYLKMQKAKSSWWPFGGKIQESEGEGESVHFTEEDWEQLNKIIGYKEGEDGQSIISNAKPDALHTFLEVHMKRNASKLYDGEECLGELSCEGLDCSVKLFPETKIADIKLGTYRLSSPSGLLAESASAFHSLRAVFCYKPFDAKVDWSLVAKASPCYMTYLKDSIDRIVNFFGSGTAVSQTIALETVAAVQLTIDEVRRTAHQQMSRALKDQARFLLDLDIAAPKITIPTEFHPDGCHSTKLLLDLGNLVIRSQDDDKHGLSEGLDMYLQFDLVLSDVSAFLVDGDYSWKQVSSKRSSGSGRESYVCVLPVIDRCGVVLKLQQIRVPNPSYPSTRLSVRLPTLGFQFSPARYHRLMQVAQIFQDDDEESSLILRPWEEADFEGWVSILSWKGREAVWQRRYLCLVGPFIYVLESPGSKSYKQYHSLRGKYIYKVPVELAGGVEHVLAVCNAPRINDKVMEDISAQIFMFDSEETRKTWQACLQGAVYRASGSAPIAGLSDTSSDSEESETEQNGNQIVSDASKVESLFVTGVLDELKIRFSYNHQHDPTFMAVLLAKESNLFEFRAAGGKVELSMRGNDMFIGTVLKSLEIEDLVCHTTLHEPCYLARSFVQSSNTLTAFGDTENQNLEGIDPTSSEGEEKFYEAPETLVDSFDYKSLKTPSFSRTEGLLPVDNIKVMRPDIEATESLDSFVKAQIVIYHQNSPLYENVDNQVMVTLATLSFFCRRPTILAVLGFVNAINVKDPSCESFDDSSPAATEHDRCKIDGFEDQSVTKTGDMSVKGLLGRGKSRIIFNLALNMARAQIFLMNENETKFATLSQDNLVTDIKVFPRSFSIKAALGNLRIGDNSLPNSHMYYRICDMRDPEGTSFVELSFTSFSMDDEDYEGYDYCLAGQLSEVRIVYLNRFIQEVVDYFMGFVPSNSKGVVKLKDQVTNSEKSFTTSEIEGSPAVKLDISLKKPIIVMPRCTDSLDYLKLDVVHITVKNTFQWFGGDRSELNAVHVESLTVMVMDINLNIGCGSEVGESIIQDVKGVSVTIQRSLRDLLHQIPSIEAFIKIEELRAVLSNREYQILTECAQSNILENPHVVPPLSVDIMTPSTNMEGTYASEDLGAAQTEKSETWISMKVSVVINLVELCLYTGTRDAPLAVVQISGGWLLYKSNSLGEGLLTATLKKFSVIDNREGTEKEFRLTVGRPGDMDFGHLSCLSDAGVQKLAKSRLTEGNDSRSFPSMLIVDAQFRQLSTFVSICIQKPQLLVALDFLLAVVEFFVPTVGSAVSGEEDKNLCLVDAIIMNQSIYKQQATEISLSPQSPLLVEDERFDHFAYDGNGGIIYLKDRHGSVISSPSTEPMIHVGGGKRLQFKNVVFKNGQFLDSCISLGANSSYSVSRQDGVKLEIYDEAAHQMKRDTVSQTPCTTAERSTELIIDLQAIGPELTFYNTSKDVAKSPVLSNKLLHAQLDAFGRFIQKKDEIEITANTFDLTMESNGVKILEPFDASVKYSIISGKTNIHLSVSNIFMNFSFSILRLFLAVEEDILSFLRMTSQKKTLVCTEFDKVGTIRNPSTDQIYAFWRPHPPAGFAILGDYLTPLDKAPTKGVLAVNTNLVRVKRPVSFTLIWPPLASENIADMRLNSSNSTTSDIDGRGGYCSIWLPEAPKGYVALGCVVSTGETPPLLSSVFCILASSVLPCSLRDCIAISCTDLSSESLAFWRVDNSVGTFLPADPSTFSLLGRPYELRHMSFGGTEVLPEKSGYLDVHTSQDNTQLTRPQALDSFSSVQSFEVVATFQLVWWNRGSGSRKKVSIWRPVISEGMVYFGDIAVRGYEPPNTCLVLRDTGEQEILRGPADFQPVGRIKKQRGMESISFWMPYAPPGFVSLGCIACKGTPKQYDFSKLRCIRCDTVAGDQFSEDSLWDTSDTFHRGEPFSMWSIGNELKTFIIRSGFKRPPRRFALKLADQDMPAGSDDIVIHAEIRTFSAALFDDYGGLMVPLVNLSLSDIGFKLLGKTDYKNSTASFSLAARSYNDKYEAWEPLIEPVHGFLRYQFNPKALGAVSQLRLTSTKDLNVNISVSNANTIIQAYASWCNLSNVHEYHREEFRPILDGRSIIEVHHQKNYFIIPQNKLGQDVFIRATEIKGLKDIVKMPSGDMKPVKVPVLTNMLDSHMRGEFCRNPRTMVSIIVVDAQLSKDGGLSSHQYSAVVRLIPNRSLPVESVLRQSACTCGGTSKLLSSELEVVNWNEIFFFKIDSLDDYVLELMVTDLGKGAPVGFCSVPLSQIALYINDDLYQHNYVNDLIWIELSSTETMNVNGVGHEKKCGRIRCAVLLPPKSKVEDGGTSSVGRKSGFIQISPSAEGPWTTVRLNYAAPAACWRLGSDVVASEVSMQDGNRYVSVRSLVSVQNNTDFLLDLCLQPKVGSSSMPEIPSGMLKPGDTLPIPLSGVTKSGSYILRLKPAILDGPDEYSWSSVVARPGGPEAPSESEESEICISALTESEHLLSCILISGTSGGFQKLWFCLNVQATEIAKDIHSDPIQDWTLVVKSPLSIANYLPLGAEYSVLEMHASGHFVGCCRGVFGSGETVKVYSANLRNPLYLSLLPQRGWLPMHEAVLISHPYGVPSKTFGLRSSATGRTAQVILEQNYNEKQQVLSKIIRVYAPYWFSIARCPSLTLRLLDLTGKNQTRKTGLPFRNKKNGEVIVEEVTEEEIFEGHTIASALNFKWLGLSVSISQFSNQQYGPAKDLSPLGDMDGSLDVYADAAEGKLMRLFVCTKPCTYQSVPTKVVSVRPFMTFTNRIGEDIYIKLNSKDEPKVLHAYDSRVSFVYQPGGRDELQVRLKDTEWSFPVQIVREDTIVLVLRSQNGARGLLKTEIRGFEEGSRFTVIFRLGSSNGPIRIENRTTAKIIRVRQSGFGEDSWISLEPLSTTNFSWEDPYGQKFLDAKIENGPHSGVLKLDMETGGVDSELLRELEVKVHVIEIGGIKISRFTDDESTQECSYGEIRPLTPVGDHGYSHLQTAADYKTTTLELIIELGLVGISVVDHGPREMSYLYLERVFMSYSTGYDEGRTSRFKLILGHLQVDNQLPLTLMPVLLAPDHTGDSHQPVFKMTITMCNGESDGIQVYPYVYIRVTENTWRLNIHEPIIWASVDFYNHLQLDRIPSSPSVTQVDPEIHINLIDISEVRLKVSMETAPSQRPHGVLGVWSPILSAVGNAFKIQVHLRRVMHRDRFIRKSSILPAIASRIWRDLIHNPLHLIFSVDVLGMTSSTLASLSKGFAELSTDGQFLQLRTRQVWSRRITGVGDGIVQGTEALAQGVAFGVSGVVTKPVESARQNGLLGFAHGLGRAFLGFIVQPVSGALDFFSLTVDGIGASCTRCLEVLNNRTALERIRNPRAIHSDATLREYNEREAIGQMVLQLAEASRHFGCTEIFREPSKFALSDYYEEYFIVPYRRIVMVTNKRVMLLQCPDLDKMDKKPSKIMWDVPWEELMSLELAKAGSPQPSLLILHLKNFQRSENFARVIKCDVARESDGTAPQAVQICSIVRKMWKAYQSKMKSLVLKVPSSRRHVYFAWNEVDGRESKTHSNKAVIKSREFSSSSSVSDERKFVQHSINFSKIWSSDRESKGRCTLCKKQASEDGAPLCTIWRPSCPDGFVSVGDIAHVGSYPPNVAAVYHNADGLFALPVGYDLVWRNCIDDYTTPVSIWHPRAPDGYVSPGCVAVAGFTEPEADTVYCMAESLAEETVFEEQKVWSSPDSYPWACHIYQVRSDALHFVALRQPKEESNWRPMRVRDDYRTNPSLLLEDQ